MCMGINALKVQSSACVPYHVYVKLQCYITYNVVLLQQLLLLM
jgi:hypothetical protein